MRIFVSYVREDRARIQATVDGLRVLGHTAWFDEHISGGQQWWAAILNAIRECDAIIAFVSERALSSAACTRERGYALALNRPMIPMLVDTLAPDRLPLDITHLHMVDYVSQDQAAAFRLAAALAQLVPVPLPTVLPEPPPAPMSFVAQLRHQVQAPTLTLDDQYALLGKIRGAIRHVEDREGALAVLDELKLRRDLFASIAREIDHDPLFAEPARTSFVRRPQPQLPEALVPRQLVSVTMPRLGEEVTEGTVTRWLKKKGDRVAMDEALLEVSTDKVDTEIPSPATGILVRIVVREDETAAIGSELAVIETSS